MKVGIEVSKGYLRLRFPRALFNGDQKYLSLNLTDTAENRVAAKIKVRQIELDILAGYFDSTLTKYKPHYEPTKKEKAHNLVELWEKYVEFRGGQVEESTIMKDYSVVEKRIKAFPTTDLSEAVLIRNHLLSIYSAETTKRTIKQIIKK